MGKSAYEVYKKDLKELDFEVLVLKIPKDEIEDKLAYLAREKGNISRSFFEDFIISTCIANINQLLFFIRGQFAEQPDLMEVRTEIMNAVNEINPLLAPENLVINRNYVIKLKNSKNNPKKGEKLLVDNKSWALSYYNDFISDAQREQDAPENNKSKKKDKKIAEGEDSNVKDIDELEYEVLEQWWKRLNQYINIKKYKESDLEGILEKRFFHNRSSFQTFIVSICVIDFEDLFNRLDDLGIPQRVAPPILMNEIYKLCEKINPFLTYEKAQDLATEDLEDENQQQGEHKKTGHPNKMASAMSDQYKKKGKKKKRFKDVPKEDLLTLADKMKMFVIGQDEAIDSLVEAIQRASVGLKDPIKPIGSFLFAGSTGCGKTLSGKVLANELIKDRNNIITIDCSEYSSDHEYSKLIGAPPSYIGFEQGGILTNAIAKTPFSVVVFDEIEKASNKVHELLLQVLEEGRLTDGKGNKVTFKNAIIIMTSNIGVREVENIGRTIGFGDVAKITDEKKDKALTGALKKKFKPEFLNRLDATINFKTLRKSDYMKIIDIELYKLNDHLKINDTEYKDIELVFDNKVKKFIYRNGIDENFGARPLKRYIEKNIGTPLASKLLKEEMDADSIINMSVKRNKIVMDAVRKIEEAPFYISEGYKESKTLSMGE